MSADNSLDRRHFLSRTLGRTVGGAASLAGLGSLALAPGAVQASDYRALVVLFLTGGNDGHNCLVPTDAAYGDYQRARSNLALPRDSLVALPGQSAGHSFGLHPALASLAPLYAQQRLAWIANAGVLIKPVTAAEVRSNVAEIPPFLGSHSDQVLMTQGWTADLDLSGWAGRGMELLPSALRHPLSAVSLSNSRTLVQGRRTSPSYFSGGSPANWGSVNLNHLQRAEAQALQRLAQGQSRNAYANEYLRTLQRALDDSILLTVADQRAVAPTQDFGSSWLGKTLHRLAGMLPVFKAQGLRRQVFLVQWGGFDTHTNQRGSNEFTQDAQLAQVAQAVGAFDAAMRAAGMDDNLVTLMSSEFGRTVRPGSGGGSEHGWGNHLFALGGPVAGGQVLGSLADFTLGGADDGDANANGRQVPTTAMDQVGATLMQWLGLPSGAVHEAFPWLANFDRKTIALLHG